MAKERKWGFFQIQGTAEEFLGDATSMVEELRDEMQEGLDNMSGTNLESTGKYSTYEEAVSALEDICLSLDGVELPESVATVPLETREERQRSLSRARRLGNAEALLNAAIQALTDAIGELEEKDSLTDDEQGTLQSLEEAMDSIQSAVDGCGSVDFPGFYG